MTLLASAAQRLLFGQATEADAATPPALWQAGDGVTDGDTAFTLLVRTQPIVPAGFGGTCVFRAAHLTTSGSLGGTLRVTPLVDEELEAPVDTDLSAAGLGEIVTLPALLTLDQEAATASGRRRRTRTHRVPLVRARRDADGVEQERFYVRGARCALLIESVGALGVGELRLDGIEIEVDILRADPGRVADA